MATIAEEVSQKLKSAIKAKLSELGAYDDDELPNYVMVMVTNRRSKAEMDKDLNLFLGANTSAFTTWLQSVFKKLEEVTITAPTVLTKRKPIDKKKKTKKSIKGSSDSEEEKKHKKKRKLSDSSSKDGSKKKKIRESSKDLSDSESDDEVSRTDTTNTVKQEMNNESSDEDVLGLKDDFESGLLSDNESTEPLSITKKIQATLPVQKLTSEVESKRTVDNESPKETIITAKRKPLVRNFKKTVSPVLKSKSRSHSRSKTPPSKMIRLKRKRSTSPSSEDVGESKKTISIRKRSPSRSRSKSQSKIIRLKRNKSTSPSSDEIKKSSKQAITSNRSRSRSKSQTNIIRIKRKVSASPSSEDVEERPKKNNVGRKIRLRASSQEKKTTILSFSRSRSRSPLTSIAARKLQKHQINDLSPVMDARELLNRKRAKGLATTVVNASVEKSENKVISVRDRDHLKNKDIDAEENEVVITDEGDSDLVDDENQLPPAVELTRKLTIKRQVGKRNIIVQSSTTTSATPKPTLTNSSSGKLMDLRDIKRTVYTADGDAHKSEDEERDEVDETERNLVEEAAESVRSGEEEGEEEDEEEEEEEKSLSPSSPPSVARTNKIPEQLLKQLKSSDKQVASTVVKIPKPTRVKPTGAQAATSTLIRKAMADAHKSLNTKNKKDTDGKVLSTTAKENGIRLKSNGAVKRKRMDDDVQGPQDTHMAENEVITTGKQNDGMEVCQEDGREHVINKDRQEKDVEEYDPSLNMPKFVVTLTGLDPNKLFPLEDNGEMMEINEDDDHGLDDQVKNKIRVEKCKYFPLCNLGDACAYYHPTVPCKLFPNCKFGSTCLYVHPKCKFDAMCTRYDCNYLHTSPKIAAPAPVRHFTPTLTISSQPCRFYYNCINPNCAFQHPKNFVQLCRFDRFCTNKSCTFSHTSLSHVTGFAVNKLKWSRPKDENVENVVEQKQHDGMITSSN